MDLSIELLPTVVKNLEDHPEISRIKKFIYCLNRRNWENNLDIINQSSLEELLIELITIQPTIQRLSLAIYELLKSLNRQKTYAVIAQNLLEELAPIYNFSKDDLENSHINQFLKKDLAEKNNSPSVYINLMEVLVKEAVFQELEKLPLKINKSLNAEEIIAYALNHLPPLYVASEEGKAQQLNKARLMKDKIHLVVVESVKVIMRNPIRQSTPLKVRSIFSIRHPN